MKRKFESELGKRIVEGEARVGSVNAGVIASVIVCAAVLVGSAAFLLPVLAGAEVGKPIYYEDLVLTQDDYLVNVDGQIIHTDPPTDVDFDVKRVMTLKQATFSSPSVQSDAEYNKFIYTLNVNLKDLELFVPENAVVGELAIEYPLNTLPLVSWTMAVNGVVIASDLNPIVAPVTWSVADADGDETNDIMVAVALPASSTGYFDGDVVSIQVMAKVPVYLEGIFATFTEEAWPDFLDRALYAPVAVISPDAVDVPIGSTVVFDGSGSTDELGIASYEWALDGAVVGTDLTVSLSFDAEGTFVVSLTVTDADDMSDVATATVAVYRPLVAPEAVITADVLEVEAGVTVTLDGSASCDDLGVVSFEWVVDGVVADTTLSTIDLTFDVAGVHVVTLTVTDGDGLTDTAEVTITVVDPVTQEELPPEETPEG